jgi:hypothetical protein
VPKAASVSRVPARHNLNQDLNRCLKQYATAALGAAGVSTLAMAQAPTTTNIVYTPANIALTEPNPGTVVPIDFNHDGVPDITISATGFSIAYSGHGGRANGSIFEAPAPGNLAIGGHALAQGVPLSQGGAFRSTKQKMAWGNFRFLLSTSNPIDSSGGPFKDVSNKYLGVKFKVNGQFHFGWIRVSITTHPSFVSGTITGYAFNSIANVPIFAGQLRPAGSEQAAIQNVPPGSLGMLAAGAQAIPYWKK